MNIQMDREGGTLKLVIEDDGTGIRAAVSNSMRPSFGMAGMHERIATLGGQMNVESRKGEGTRISVTVPVPTLPEDPETTGTAHARLVNTGS